MTQENLQLLSVSHEHWSRSKRRSLAFHLLLTKFSPLFSYCVYFGNKWQKTNMERQILVIFSGGTIGMVRGVTGSYQPIPNMLEAKLRTIPQLHDSAYHLPNDTSAPPLVLPTSNKGRHVLYKVLEYDPLSDSSNMGMDDWIQIAKDIRCHYEQYDGFVVLHGTDTMAFTASALSFMLDGLSKPVVVTGSQIPIFETRTDGQDNFQGALIMAAEYDIPEVSIYFNHRLYRGNRTTKISSDRLDAFDSPNCHPLVKLGVDINVNWKSVLLNPANRQLTVHTNLCKSLSVLTLFPGIPSHIIHSHLDGSSRGVVLQSFGAGNVPIVRTDLMQQLKEASNRGVLIVNITQCLRGSVAPLYETGRPLLEAGIIPGADMTMEAALAKLAYVLGRDDWDLDTKRKMMQKSLKGEMTSYEIKTQKLLKDMKGPFDVCNAIVNGDAQLLKEEHLQCVDVEKRTPLHIAALLGQLNVAHFLLKNAASVNCEDQWNLRPIDYAISSKHHHLVKLMHEYGGSPGAHLNHIAIAEAISSAAACGDVSVLKIYNKLGLDFNLRDSLGRTCMHQAVLNNQLECVEYLLNVGVNPLLQDGQGFSSCDLAKRLGLFDIQNQLDLFSNSTLYLFSSST